jgi:hypothetical protein
VLTGSPYNDKKVVGVFVPFSCAASSLSMARNIGGNKWVVDVDRCVAQQKTLD